MLKKGFLNYIIAGIIVIFTVELSYAQTFSGSDVPPLRPIVKTTFDTAYTKIYYDSLLSDKSSKSPFFILRCV